MVKLLPTDYTLPFNFWKMQFDIGFLISDELDKYYVRRLYILPWTMKSMEKILERAKPEGEALGVRLCIILLLLLQKRQAMLFSYSSRICRLQFN